MTGKWTDAEGVTYPVLVEFPVYYPDATEPTETAASVTVGDLLDENAPWLGFGEGYLMVTNLDNTITATGVVEHPMGEVAFDITISGTISAAGLEGVEAIIVPVKVIKNGQLIIRSNEVEYNANGTVIK
jgi:hypothetical protein